MDSVLESIKSIATTLLGGNLIGILVAIIATISLPVIFHLTLYRKAATPSFSTFVLLGPSGVGKTAFLTAVESASLHKSKGASNTHTSQESTSTTVTLPPSVPIHSNRYRSVNDSSLADVKRNPVKYVLRDTPGHGKLRTAQLTQLEAELRSKKKTQTPSIRGIIFFIDAASISEDAESLRENASYLYDTLLVLQKTVLSKTKSKTDAVLPVLVAANKQDLFTALPPGSVRQKLEQEIDRIRETRQKGLMDASAGAGVNEDEEEVLGGEGSNNTFTFQTLEEDIGLKVEVVGGFVKTENEKDDTVGIRKWEEWVGRCL